MRTDALLTALGLTFIPTVGALVSIHIPALSANPIQTYVRRAVGSPRRGKLTLYCLAGPDDTFGSIIVIWKPSTGWFCWLAGKPYTNVRLERARV